MKKIIPYRMNELNENLTDSVSYSYLIDLCVNDISENGIDDKKIKALVTLKSFLSQVVEDSFFDYHHLTIPEVQSDI